MLKAQAHYFASVATREDMANNIMEMSDFMKTRFDRAADEYRYAVDEIVFKGRNSNGEDFTMKHAYILQTTIQRPMETISWQAAFNHYTEQGMTQYDAVHAADAVIRQYMTDMSRKVFQILNVEHLLNECFDVLQLVQYGLEHINVRS